MVTLPLSSRNELVSSSPEWEWYRRGVGLGLGNDGVSRSPSIEIRVPRYFLSGGAGWRFDILYNSCIRKESVGRQGFNSKGGSSGLTYECSPY